MKCGAIVGCLVIIVALAGSGAAQGLRLDHVDGLYAPDTIPVGGQVTFYIRITGSPTTTYHGIINGFRIYSPDGAQWGSTVADTLPLNWLQWFGLIFSVNRFSLDGVGADTVGFGGSYNPLNSAGLPIGFDSVTYKITIGPIDPQYNGKTIVLDSSYYPPIGRWKWAGPDAFPSWDGAYVYTIFDPDAVPTAHLSLNPTGLNFTTTELGPDPAAQSFDVFALEGESVQFTALGHTPWLHVTPATSSTPGSIQVSVDYTGLTPGIYHDSIEIASSDAVNSPVYEQVTFEVTEVLKYVQVDPTSLNYSVIFGHQNPPPDTVTVTEVNSFAIPWQATHSQSWVHLTDSSGMTPGAFSVQVDASGLAPGNYVDTAIIHWQPDPMDGYSAFTLVSLTVTPNHAPQLFEIGDFSITECESIHAIFHATDADGDPIQLWVLPLSDNMQFVDQGNGDGNFSFTPSYMQAGDYAMTAYASDGIDTVSQGFNIHVEDCQPNIALGAVFRPRTFYAFDANAVVQNIGAVIIGNFGPNHTAEDVDLSSCRILNGLIPINAFVWHYYGPFTENTVRCSYDVSAYVRQFVPFYDSSYLPVTVTGEYSDGQSFEVVDSVLFIGHRTGDVNLDGSVDISDIISLVNYFFMQGEAPTDRGTADLNKDGLLDISDLTALLDIAF